MTSKEKLQSAAHDHRRGESPPANSVPRHLFLSKLTGVLAVTLLCGAAVTVATADSDARDGRDRHGNGAAQLRAFIAEQVGGIEKLMVPASNDALPLPPDDPARPRRYQTTEAKRYLGKLLFHDPVRSARININEGQPLDLPKGTAFGGTVSASDPGVPAIVESQLRATSCGSCHIGEAAGKAGQQVNFASGGEGRGYTDEKGNFFPRRRAQSFLTRQRSTPIFPGDALVDALPTLTDIYIDATGQKVVTTPALYYHDPKPQNLLATGRLDEVDSVGRLSPSMIGFAFNNRLLLFGIAGEPQATPGSLNPLNDPAQENLTLLLLDAHRMIGFQSAELLKIPAFVQLFREAFPEEAAQADAKNDMTLLVNDDTVFRATATFLRTVVTRNTPFDKFLAGDDHALTPAQRRGAKLFFTPAMGGAGGAGCFACHSGPVLNKRHGDPDIAGRGQFVEENFHNLGIGDHPVQSLNALARGRLDPNKRGADGFPYHAEDTGRQEVTHNPDDAFKFRTLTLRQLKDARNFFHNGLFTKVRDVVEYFNAGIPQDPTPGAATNLSTVFTNPRGPGYPRGLGLMPQQVDDLTDFLENALYDPAFVRYDPNSTTDTLQPNERDLTYSKYRPDLVALGANDGMMLSGLAIDSNDPLARRDQGIEFLDVTSRAVISRLNSDHRNGAGHNEDVYRITNNSKTVIDTHLLVIAKGLPKDVVLRNASGTTSGGDPYLRIFLPNGVLEPGQSIPVKLRFDGRQRDKPSNYSVMLLSGQGTP